MANSCYDIAIIGGGINGCGIAADAAGRGLSVLLCEKDDLASATSSASSKLIHGGLRYLEHYEFKLVRESLQEREVLLKKAPHLIQPLQFVMPYKKGLRPFWMLRAGLYLYDHLGGKISLAKSKSIRFKNNLLGTPLLASYQKGLSYSDCQVDDARLVIMNAIAAKQHGATILTRTCCNKATRHKQHWDLELTRADGSSLSVSANSVINAAGPWVDQVLSESLDIESQYSAKLIKGSHIVLPKLYQGQHAYILQNHDGRIVFVIPYLEDYTLIGTTDIEYQGDPNLVTIDKQETDYLCNVVAQYFHQPIKVSDVLWDYSGVRSLLKDKHDKPSEITRDYFLDVNDKKNLAPLLTIFGGKITTYRHLAEQALQRLQPYLGFSAGNWTANKTLPGGDIQSIEQYQTLLQTRYPWLPKTLAHRFTRSYGSLSEKILSDKNCLAQLGQHFGHDLYQAEVDYLIKHEWACCVDDIIWRRSKLGLYLNEKNIHDLVSYLSA